MRSLRIKLNLRIAATLGFIGALTSSHPSQADVGEAYGFGARNAALQGASVAWGFDPYAAYHNPAALGFSRSESPEALSDGLAERRRLHFSLGLLYMQPRFRSITGVTIQNNNVSDTTQTGSVDTDYRPALGLNLAANYRLFEGSHSPSLGLIAFLPLQSATYIDSGEPFAPEYTLYRSRLHRPQFELGLGQKLTDGLSVGAGLHVGYTLTTSADAYLQADASRTSTMRFRSSLKPKLSPYLGLMWTSSLAERPWSLGLTARLPTRSEAFTSVRSNARLFSLGPSIGFVFQANSMLYYDPGQLQLGGSWVAYRGEPGVLRVFGQLDYQFWHLYRSPALAIQNPNVETCPSCSPGVIISGSNPPNLQLRNILVPRLGFELTQDRNVYRLGYSFRQSIFRGTPDGAGNFLDPSKHMLGLGFGRQFKGLLTIEAPVSVDFALNLQRLVPQTVTKTSGDELGNVGNGPKIGSPGYIAEGWVYGGGVSLTLLL